MELTAAQIKDYNENGFLMLDGYFSAQEVKVITDELPVIFEEDSPRRILESNGKVRSVFFTTETNELINCVCRMDKLVTPAMQLLGSPVYVHQCKINAKQAMYGDWWQWHQDFVYWNIEDGMPSPRVMNMVILLQEVDEFNGPIFLVPGTHRVGIVDAEPQQSALDEVKDAPEYMSTLSANLKYVIEKQTLSKYIEAKPMFSAKGKAGSVLVFHGNLFHASLSNLSPFDRNILIITYNSVENKLMPVDKPRPEFIASRNFTSIEKISNDEILKFIKKEKI
ncbi:MAG: Phytanoyl-CoA dioxygenase [Bacteroidetes bacterium]|nr:Phytanoyl-CoA dioxygenase [Bacteroidota bacterium]